MKHNLSGATQRVLLLIDDHMDLSDLAKGCWPSNTRMSELLKINKGTVSKAITKLTALGIIELSKVRMTEHKNQHWENNVYHWKGAKRVSIVAKLKALGYTLPAPKPRLVITMTVTEDAEKFYSGRFQGKNVVRYGRLAKSLLYNIQHQYNNVYQAEIDGWIFHNIKSMKTKEA